MHQSPILNTDPCFLVLFNLIPLLLLLKSSTFLLMYLQENAFDEFQMIKICPCEITKNKLHEWVRLVIFQL